MNDYSGGNVLYFDSIVQKQPGTSFSFTVTNVKGQLLKDQNVVGSKALGASGSSFDLNQIK
jgi:hypothetical protein